MSAFFNPGALPPDEPKLTRQKGTSGCGTLTAWTPDSHGGEIPRTPNPTQGRSGMPET